MDHIHPTPRTPISANLRRSPESLTRTTRRSARLAAAAAAALVTPIRRLEPYTTPLTPPRSLRVYSRRARRVTRFRTRSPSLDPLTYIDDTAPIDMPITSPIVPSYEALDERPGVLATITARQIAEYLDQALEADLGITIVCVK